MAEIVLRRLSKNFGDVKVLHEIDAHIADGEFVAIVGPSGCGKSTILRLIAGLEPISGGEVEIGGQVVNGKEPRERNIAMVFQNYALYPHMSVYDNMAYGLKVRRRAKAEIAERVKEAAAFLGLGDLLHRKPRELSGGQRQRVAMGRALVRQPTAFLFDEPLSNLDAKLRNQMRIEIKRLHQKLKTTSVYVTHDQVEAMTLADRIVVLHDGRIEQMDRPENIYHRPETTFVAGFIGSPTMNLLRGRVEENRRCLRIGDSVRLEVGAEIPAEPGDEILAGVRPEHVVLHNGAALPENHCELDTVVELLEPLGSDTVIHCMLNGKGEHMLTARLPGATRLSEGDRIRLHFPCAGLHLFDPSTGRRIASQ